MARTKIRQQSQVKSSDTFNDVLTATASMENTDQNLELDLNNLRSQINRIYSFASASSNWYDDLPTVSGSQQGLKELAVSMGNFKDKRFIYGVQILTDIAVPAGQNFVVLTASLNHQPTASMAVSENAMGAVVGVLPGAVGAWSNVIVSGTNALTPKNLVSVRDAATKFPVKTALSGTIYGLLQAEVGSSDGDSFNDTNRQGQISFVTILSGSDSLASASINDIAGKVIEYIYPFRNRLSEIPDDYMSGYINFATLLINTSSGGGGSGTITGPTASINSSVVRWNGTGGSTITDSAVSIDDSGNIIMQPSARVDGRDVGIDGNKLDKLVIDRLKYDAIAFDNPDTSGDWPSNTVVATIDVDASNLGLRNRLFTENSGSFNRAVATPPFMIPSGTTDFRFTFWTRPYTVPTASAGGVFAWYARPINDDAIVGNWSTLTNFTAFTYSGSIGGPARMFKRVETVPISTLTLTASQMGQLVIVRRSDDASDTVSGSINLLHLLIEAI